MKTKILPLFLLLFLATACQSEKPVYFFTSFHEPANAGLRMLYSYDGYHWTDLDTVLLKPEVGRQHVMRDPSIVRGPDGIFRLVWTSSWQGDLGFGYASSPDLIHWSKEQVISVMDWDTSTVNVWAPELFYDDGGQRYIIVWASTIPFKFPKGQEEERNNHRLYYTTTKDFQSFSDTKLFLDPGFSVIDGTIVKRGEHDYVLVLKDNTRPERNLKVAFGETPLGLWSKPGPGFTPKYTEGPTVLHLGDDYLIYYDAYRARQYGAVKTKDFKTFTDITDQISVPEGHKHGTIFTADEKVLRNLLKTTKGTTNFTN